MPKTPRTMSIISLCIFPMLLLSCGMPWAPTTPASVPADVYAAGAYTDSSMIDHACYWVNGSQQTLPGTGSAYAVSICVDGTGTVYNAGAYEDSGTSYACFWIGGTFIDLRGTEDSSCAVQIAIDGASIHVLSHENSGGTRLARLLTFDGSGTPVGTPLEYSLTETESELFMLGTDVYIAGTQIGPGDHAAYYRKNDGAAVVCPGNGPRLSGIWSNGTDVYVYGDIDYDACYWKNGSRVDLPEGSGVSAVTTSGADLYVAGYMIDVTGPYSSETSVAYWKNGSAWQLPGEDAISAAIQVVGGVDIYNAGHAAYQSAETACYWINGTRVDLPGPSGYFVSWADAMTVVPK